MEHLVSCSSEDQYGTHGFLHDRQIFYQLDLVLLFVAFETESCYIAQAGFELVVLGSQLLKC